MFVIQRVLESDGRLTLLDQNKVIRPHPAFRLFATGNTIGLGDTTGLYHGTQQINQAQMDRWNIVAQLNYLEHDVETEIMLRKLPDLNTKEGKRNLIRDGAHGRFDARRFYQRGFVHRDVATYGA